VVTVLDEACAALPTAHTLHAEGIDPKLVESVEACRERSTVQKRVLEREMEVWQIIEEQKRTELAAHGGGVSGLGVGEMNANVGSGAGAGHVTGASGDVDMGEAKRLQRGSVGSDRGG
jgi:indoleamine 2,3-dioxygenase